MLTFADLRTRLSSFDFHGVEQWSDALVWGRLSETTGRGWLHQVMLPYTPVTIDRFLEENEFLSAFRHPRLWREMNGFKLFAHGFSMYGPDLPSNPARVWRAYDVVSVNVGQGDLHRRFDGVIFGGANVGRRSAFLLECRAGTIVSVDRDSSDELCRWSDFDTFLPVALDDLASNWAEAERRVLRSTLFG